MYCNWFLAGFTLLAVSIYLFYLRIFDDFLLIFNSKKIGKVVSTVGLMSANGLRLTLDVEVQGVALPVRHSVGGDAGVEAGPGLLD